MRGRKRICHTRRVDTASRIHLGARLPLRPCAHRWQRCNGARLRHSDVVHPRGGAGTDGRPSSGARRGCVVPILRQSHFYFSRTSGERFAPSKALCRRRARRAAPQLLRVSMARTAGNDAASRARELRRHVHRFRDVRLSDAQAGHLPVRSLSRLPRIFRSQPTETGLPLGRQRPALPRRMSTR